MEKYIVYKYYNTVQTDLEWSFNDTVCKFGKKISYDKELIKKKILFSLVTRGKYQICYVLSTDGELIHYSFIIPYCVKFSFMHKDDLQIGPCWTNKKYRGQGIYGRVLDFVAQKAILQNPNTNLYVLIRKANIDSTKGIKKANYIPVGECEKTKRLKLYNTVEWYK